MLSVENQIQAEEDLEAAITTYAHDEQGHRVDVHRPSAINPGDYEYTGVSEARAALKEGQKLAGPGGVCHHCGKAIVWRVHFKHLPTGNIVTFGYQCAGILQMTDNRIDHEMNLLKRRAENERREEEWQRTVDERRENFLTNHKDVYDFVMEYDDDFARDYIGRYKAGVERFGSLLDWQIDKVKDFMQKREVFLQKKLDESAKLANASVLTDGRQHVEGEVISTKWVHNERLGIDVHKMLVQTDEGNKVFGTIPASLSDVEKGDRVSFDGKIEAKEDHFGFFSRPTKGVKL